MRSATKIFIAVLIGSAALCSAQVDTLVWRAPEFPDSAVWLDEGARSIKDYRGRVLLVDFWEYTCINCIRDFAVVKRWYSKYHPYGFDVLGVHYGEFAIGHNPDNVRRAAKRLRLPWPVISDVPGATWKAYGAKAWPNRYLIDQDGNIVLQVIGEGNNPQLEEKIRELLAESRPDARSSQLDREQDYLTPQCGIPTQETYVGQWHGRGAVENHDAYRLGKVTNFHAGRLPRDGGVMLAGKWRGEVDSVTSDARDARATLRYHARSVYAVLSLTGAQTARVYLTQDDKPLDWHDAGADVRFDNKGAYLDVAEPRMYYLVKNSTFGSHALTLAPESRGVSLYSFTFGNNCQQDFEEY